MTMLKKKLGFTLVELLAVTLIIAALTAVALPKYRRTIERAASTEALVNLRSIFESAKRYKAANSVAPTKLKGLDIAFYDASSEEENPFTINKYEYKFLSSHVQACRLSGNYCFYMYYNHPTKGRDVLTCKITTTGGKYDWLCDAMGDEDLGSNEYLIKG